MNHLHRRSFDEEFAGALGCDERLAAMARSLWAATSFDELLKAFAALLQARFAVDSFDIYALQERGSRLFLHPHQVLGGKEREQLKSFGPGLREDLPAGLLSLAGQKECADGVQSIILQGEPVQVSFFGGAEKSTYVCVWNEVAAETALLESLVAVTQNECRWYRKLDSTQALLYLDELTGLFNYRYLDVALDSELRRASRYQQYFSLLFIDLDNFKDVNDCHGHLAGSSVLKQVGTVLREELREVDTVIRYGGDEYVVILLGATTRTGVLVAERIRARIAQTAFQVDLQTMSLTSSIGVASYPEHGRDKDTLLRMADETMYRSKRGGKNRVMIVGGPETVLKESARRVSS